MKKRIPLNLRKTELFEIKFVWVKNAIVSYHPKGFVRDLKNIYSSD